MSPLRILFSLLIINILIPFCRASAPYSEGKIDTLQTNGGLGKFAPLGVVKESLLFKAAIHVFGDYYSGLILVKQLPADSAIHVVFLSELGLNLLDMAFRNDRVEVVSVQEFLNRPSILKTLQNDFQTLLLDLSQIVEFKVRQMDDGVTEVLKFRYNSQRYAYNYCENLGPVRIRRRNGLFERVDFQIGIGETKKTGGPEPLEIRIVHRGIRLRIDLTELKR
ncbi:MAG: hypothetical protein R6W31_19330 [Bacteroidales bacterium]